MSITQRSRQPPSNQLYKKENQRNSMVIPLHLLCLLCDILSIQIQIFSPFLYYRFPLIRHSHWRQHSLWPDLSNIDLDTPTDSPASPSPVPSFPPVAPAPPSRPGRTVRAATARARGCVAGWSRDLRSRRGMENRVSGNLRRLRMFRSRELGPWG